MKADTVRPGDLDGINNLYRLNLADEATRLQHVGSAERFSPRSVKERTPALGNRIDGVPAVTPSCTAYLPAGAREPIRNASPRPESRTTRRSMAAASVASLPHTVTPVRARVTAV